MLLTLHYCFAESTLLRISRKLVGVLRQVGDLTMYKLNVSHRAKSSICLLSRLILSSKFLCLPHLFATNAIFVHLSVCLKKSRGGAVLLFTESASPRN